MENYDIVVAALKGLKSKGFSLDFNIAFDKIICNENGLCLNPNEFEITAVFRFEGDSNPSDENIVYDIESKDGSIKGSLTSAYGLYADTINTVMLQKLTIHHHQ